MLDDWELFRDEETGMSYFVDTKTGEYAPAEWREVPVGSLVLSPDVLEATKLKRDREQKRALAKEANTPLGRYFYFVPSVEQFDGVRPEFVTKLIYLNTYLNYDGRLMMSRRSPIMRSDLADVLRVSKATVSRFWKELSPRFLFENDQKIICSNENVFKRKGLKRKCFDQYQKFWFDGVRQLYEASPVSNHGRLGYLFKLLPFINVEYNVLCYPEYILETDPDRIKLLSIAEFCRLIGYDVGHFNELASAYRDIRFPVGKHTEPFCKFNYDGIDRDGATICINPHILYNGSNYDNVKAFGMLFSN